MKIIVAQLIYLAVIILFTFGPSHKTVQSMEEIISTIQSGSSRKLAKYFNGTIALNINNNPGDFSKNQAELIIRDFFRKFPPEGFKVVHQGESAETLWFFIANYESEEADFKVLVKGKHEEGAFLIYSIDFTKD